MSAVIHINGFSGVGKLAIAKQLVKLLGDARLLDNHAWMDAAFALHRVGSKPWLQLCNEMRRLVYQSASDAKPGTALVLTNVLYSDRCNEEFDDFDTFEQVSNISNERQVPLLAVTLTCEPIEHRRRLTRRRSSHKLRRWKSMARALGTFTLLRPDDVPHLEIDVTNLTAAEAAQCIVQHVRQISVQS